MRARLLVAAMLLLAPAAAAGHCATWSTSTTTTEHVVLDTGSNEFVVHYLAFDVCQPGCLFSVWVYREYNGIPGLQRGDVVVDDTCHGMIEPDGFEF